MKYKNFEKYVLRSPLLPISFYFNLTRGKEVSIDEIKEKCNDPIIKEALFLASPTLYESFEKWLKAPLKTADAEEKMLFSILKYLSRMSSRCTPFGLFAGTAVGQITSETKIELKNVSNYKRSTRLDMNYLVALSQDIVKNKHLKNDLVFYPNTSMYKTGNQLRYVEYHYENSRRIHHIVGVSNSEYLEKILHKAQSGASLNMLAEEIIDDEIDFQTARNFIDELVESQVVVSELEASVSGQEFDKQLLEILHNQKHADTFIKGVQKAQKALNVIDATLGNSSSNYRSIASDLGELGTAYDIKYLFQTDMILQTTKNTFDQQWLAKAKRAIRFLNRITKTQENTPLKEFMDAFRERYEDREVSLAQALDVELGIGFLQNKDAGDVSSLLDDIVLPLRSSNTSQSMSWNTIQRTLYTLLQECTELGNELLELKDDTFGDLTEDWNDLPDTISAMAEIVNEGDGQQLVLSSCGGTSAANLLGRFCYGEPEMLSHVEHIVEIEKQCNPDVILAEIVHLPEARVGNILMRPSFREYEIPYLAKSNVSPERQLPLEDLMISIRQGRVYLRSKKYNKEVIPYLSNAHNYSNGALPIYQFLANLQGQGKRRGLYFGWGSYASHSVFLPRVIYKDVIISVKTWHFKTKQIEELKKAIIDQELLALFMNTYKLPQYILLVQGDNELLINLHNHTSLNMLLSIIGKKSESTFKEFLHLNNGIVTNGEETYTNQFVFSFYNESKVNRNA